VNRRDAIRMGAAAAVATCAGCSSVQPAQPQRVLIFGGTGFIGPHFVEALRGAGHKLTLFNRGRRNPGLFPDVETLIGDRNGDIQAIKGRDWDVVIDDSGYLPKQVKLTAETLRDHVQHYIFVSSISAYADFAKPDIDEDYKLAQLKDANSEDIGRDYGALKAVCENIVETTYGKRWAVIRPTFIVGPGDTTDRFTYWPVRVTRGGEMLAPGTPRDPVQFIDVRDLAAFMRSCVERRIAGRYNLCNPPRSTTIGDVLETSKRISGSNATFVWADAKFLNANKALEGNDIPIWAPPESEFGGAALVSSTHAVAQGLRFRELETTIRDTLAWHTTRPAEQQQKLRAGLTPEREAELLAKLRSASG
jgi:2'-hydroxyisoflavone reductase